MALPPCIMRLGRPFPDGSVQDYCQHPQYPYRLRLLALQPGYCHTCPLRQEDGPPPPPTPLPPVPDPAAYTPGKSRPDLQGIEATLPPFVEGRDRKVHFEADGAIVYEKQEGAWEPPRAIDGYVRDPNNLWRLLPLWPVCALRLCTGVRLVNCGCIGVIMRCNSPRSTVFGQQVKYSQCAQCKVPEKNT